MKGVKEGTIQKSILRSKNGMCKGPEVGQFTCVGGTLKRSGWLGRKGDDSRRVTGSWTVKGLVGQSEVWPGKSLYGLGRIREVA